VLRVCSAEAPDANEIIRVNCLRDKGIIRRYMDQLSETKRLADAVANIAATITGIIDVRMQAAGLGLEQKIALKTIDPFLPKKQVAEHLHVSVRTLDIWMARGILPYYKIGRMVRFRLSDIQECFDARCKVGLKRSR